MGVDVSDQPSGIHDLFLDHDLDAPTLHDPPDVYFWCRRHEQAHKYGENCREQLGGPGGGSMGWRMPFNDECIDVGPFMSEREAQRLAGNVADSSSWVFNPLGMEVES